MRNQLWKWITGTAGVSVMMQILFSMTSYAAVYFWSTEVDNTITTGDVSIAIEEYEMGASGMEIAYRNGKTVLPGQTVSKIVKIENKADDVWIRTRVQFNSAEGIQNLDEELLGEVGKDWVKQGDYFYYQKPVFHGEIIEFIREIRIPSEWDEEVENQSFQVGIVAQAVQTANFIPDFFREDPWFGVPIEACVHSEHDGRPASGEGRFEILFENGTEGFVKSSDDFFKEFASMMPGDTMTGTMEFGSHYNRNLDIGFRSERIEGQSEEAQKLLADLQLKIIMEEKVLYEGSLGEADLELNLISNLKKRERKTVTFAIYMPEHLKNDSALQQAKVRWIFTTGYQLSDGGSGSSGDGDSSDFKPTKQVFEFLEKPMEQAESLVQDAVEYLGKLPVTGDSGNPVLFFVMVISGGLAFCLSEKGDEDD